MYRLIENRRIRNSQSITKKEVIRNFRGWSIHSLGKVGESWKNFKFSETLKNSKKRGDLK